MNKEILIKELKSQGISKKILESIKAIDREKFVPEEYKEMAYNNIALPLGEASTISQPYTLAFMLDMLDLKKDSKQKVLEIGSGSGYSLALINNITKGKTYGIEINKRVALNSKKNLEKNKDIKVFIKSGIKGLPEETPFDRILISASASEIPLHLLNQLEKDGIIVSSVRTSIYKIKKTEKGPEIEEYPGFVFVPLQDSEK